MAKRRIDIQWEDPNLLPEQIYMMKKFNQEKELTGMAHNTRWGYMVALRALGTFIKKPFDEMDKEDLLSFIDHIKHHKSASYKIYVKAFLQWVHKMPRHQYPECIAWLQPKAYEKKKLPDEILTVDEVKKIAEATYNLRDRAIIMVLYEGGIRAGELIGLRVKDVAFDKYGATIKVDGKTGMRRVRLINSVPDIKNWLNHHPFGKDPNAALFPQFRDKRSPMGNHATLGHIVKKATKRAKIKKNVHTHLFRHSRATHLANQLTEQQLKVIFGWTGASRQVATYVHLSGADVDKRMLEINGLVEKEEPKNNPLKPRDCPRCKKTNPATARFCIECAAALDLQTAIEVDEKRSVADAGMSELMDDPEVQEVVLGRAIKLGLKDRILGLGKS